MSELQPDYQVQWGIVELMGHKVVAGAISKSELFGKPMLRVDVPSTNDYPEYTQLYGEAAIYCMTFTSEEVARRTANQCRISPVTVYVPDLVTREKFDELAQQLKHVRQLSDPDQDEEDGD
jgi:hypothetical protein